MATYQSILANYSFKFLSTLHINYKNELLHLHPLREMTRHKPLFYTKSPAKQVYKYQNNEYN